MLLPLLALVAHASPDIDKINEDLSTDPPNIERAQRRCTKWEAWRMSVDPALRDVCARAFWYTAEAEDTVEAWSAYRKRWAATKGEQPALEREARAKLLVLGEDAAEEAYLQLTRQYPGTQAAVTAKAMAEHKALQSVDGVAEALRVMNQYPDLVSKLLAEYLPALVDLEVRGLSITAKLHDGVPPVQGHPLETFWAAHHSDDTLVPWDDEARAHLAAGGLDAAVISRLDGPASRTTRRYPLCYDPTADPGWQAGVAVRLGEAAYFEVQPYSSSCAADTWPVFLTTSHGRVTSLSLQPGHLLQFPTQQAFTGFTWGANAEGIGGTDLYLPFPPGEPVTVGNAQVVGQQLGPLYLVHPVGGGLPWLTDMSPPKNAVPLPMAFEATRLPEGWAVLPGPGGGSKVTGPYPGEAGSWTLPPGDVRQLTPLLQWATGLHRHNPKLTSPAPEPLPALSKPGAWSRSRVMIRPEPPAGAQPLQLQQATPEQVSEGLRMLHTHGVELEVHEAWAANLDKDRRPELILEGERGGVEMRVVVDTFASGARRVFLFDAGEAERFDAYRGQQFAFVRGGTAYVAWTGMKGPHPFVEAVHLDDRGLVREYLR